MKLTTTRRSIAKTAIILIVCLLSVLVFRARAPQPFDTSKISTATMKIVAEIEKGNTLTSGAVGEAGVKTRQYEWFEQLLSHASKEELTRLTDHPNGVVRCYSFWALSYDSSFDRFPMIMSHLNDTQTVTTEVGCLISNEYVGDFFIDVANTEKVDVTLTKLNTQQQATLDSTLLYTPNKLGAKSRAIDRALPTDKLYARARYLVTSEHNADALALLARYKREQDVPTLLTAATDTSQHVDPYYIYNAITEFPHAAFIPFLRKQVYEAVAATDGYRNDWTGLYEAIASYKDKAAAQLLCLPFAKVSDQYIRPYHIEAILAAITEYRCPLYDSLLWAIWQHDHLTSVAAYDYLAGKDPLRSYSLTTYALSHIDDFQSEELDVLVPRMLDAVLQRDRALAVTIIRTNLKQTDANTFLLFAEKAATIKDASFVKPLLARLYKEENAYIYLKAAEILISYNDTKINKNILTANQLNKRLTHGWGGEEFTKMLKDNHIAATTSKHPIKRP